MNEWVREQIRLIHYAVMFYTRIPVPSLSKIDQTVQDHSSRYFPLIGWLVGGLTAIAFILADLFLPHDIAVLISMCFSVWITGAFHEDGLADSCDGLGGGWDKERILNIMKDSRVGTYGLVGLGAVLAMKFLCLTNLSASLVPYALVLGHVFSRWYSNAFMWKMEYVRLDESSKSKPITKGFKTKDFQFATILSVPALFLLPLEYAFSVLGALPFLTYFYVTIKKWLGGYTGDALGAVQQLAEVGIYLGLLALVTY